MEDLSSVPLVNLPSKIGYIDTSIALTRNIEFIRKILWEALKPILNSGKSILGY